MTSLAGASMLGRGTPTEAEVGGALLDVVIEFETCEPPAGRVRTPTDALEFQGWLALLALLEATVGDPRPE